MRLNEKFDSSKLSHLGLKNFDLAFDIGAYDGDSVVGIRSIGYRHIICVEPDPKNFKKLEAKYGNALDITLLQNAVTDKSSEIVKLHSTRNLPFLNSLDPKWLTETRHKQYYREKQYEEVEVATLTISDIVNIIGKQPDYIKIDVEGYEKYVIRGLDFKPELLSFEWISERLDDNLSCLSMLRDLGFTSFYICFGEDLPKSTDDCYGYNMCAMLFIDLKDNDEDNVLSGNCFCV